MEWTITLAIIGASAILTGFAIWKSGRPRKDSLKPSWISWPFMILLGGAVLMLAGVHALNMMGVTTGAGRQF
jgi:hypothetical protein